MFSARSWRDKLIIYWVFGCTCTVYIYLEIKSIPDLPSLHMGKHNIRKNTPAFESMWTFLLLCNPANQNGPVRGSLRLVKRNKVNWLKSLCEKHVQYCVNVDEYCGKHCAKQLKDMMWQDYIAGIRILFGGRYHAMYVTVHIYIYWKIINLKS